jgi:hypothetical protein
MDVHLELLARLRAAIDREMSISTGLAYEIVEQTRHVSILSSEEHEARRRAEGFDPRLAGMSNENINTLAIADADERRGLRQVQRVTGRDIVTEQMRAHAEAASRAGVDPGAAAQAFAQASARIDPAALWRALEAATAARVKAEADLAALEAERSRHGRRGGQLRATLDEADRWLAAQGTTIAALAA